MPATPEISPFAASSLSVSDARARMLAAVRGHAPAETQWQPLMACLGRVLAEDVLAPQDVPPHDNAAMDGYAFSGQALQPGQPTRLRGVGRALAGHPYDGPLAAGDCVRIMTGAVMPVGTDTVVPQELCTCEGEAIVIAPGTLRAGDHRRHRGEDLAQGQPALRAGRRLTPADLGLAASLGLTQLRVVRRLVVALFSSGDELRSPGEPLPVGCLYDSNRFSLGAALSQLGFEVLDLGRVPDDPAALEATLDQALAQADAVVTSGGVSVGDADHTRALLARRGTVDFWSVAMRPGRPFAFGALQPAPGRTRPCWLFALPGNPVAALVSLEVLARDALLALAGAAVTPLPRLQARSAGPVRKRPGRTEFPRVLLQAGEDGVWRAQLTAAQGSGVLSSLAQAQGLAVLPAEQGDVAAGDWIEILPFDGLF